MKLQFRYNNNFLIYCGFAFLKQVHIKKKLLVNIQ